MNVLILGSGGRENALAWKIRESKKVDNLFVAPGNAGTELLTREVNGKTVGCKNVAIKADDFDAIKKFVLENDIEMVVVGPAGVTTGFPSLSSKTVSPPAYPVARQR